jgi:antirestriction protein ArdC
MNAFVSISKIIAYTLRQGDIPWKTFQVGYPTNVLSNKKYSGVNSILLQISALQHNFNRSCVWGSVKQWGTVQCRVPYEAKPTEILVVDASGRPTKRKIFNTDQVIGLTMGQFISKLGSVGEYSQVDLLLEKSGAKVVNGLTPMYRDGMIEMPPRSFFKNDPQYWGSIIHELCHDTELKVGFTGDEFQRELVAEIATGYLEGIFRLEHCSDRKNHDKYLSQWLEEMDKNPKFIINSASIASRIVYHLMNLVNPKDFSYAE